MKAHKHAEVIKAWADGAEIEVRNLSSITAEHRVWKVTYNPAWYDSFEYRVKPPREFPKSSLTGVALVEAYATKLGWSKDTINSYGKGSLFSQVLRDVADAAVKQYILDQESAALE